MSNIKATIITIGDELLIGQTIDTNSAWIAKHLNELGIEILRRVAVGDEKQAIIDALDEESKKVQVIVITGGLGPTSDDITKPLLCAYFNGQLKVHEPTLQHIKELFAKLNRPVIERNLKQAEIPDVCIPLFNRMGTAPGMWFEKTGVIYISLPGVPYEMVAIMEDEVLPKLSSQFISDAIVHVTTLTSGEGESFIAEKLIGFEAQLPIHVKLAYLPDNSFVKLRLTGRGADKAQLERELRLLQSEIIQILEPIVIAKEDLPMERILANTLMELNKSLGTAESCTGGYIGHQITQIPGASKHFIGSIVSYSTSIKENILGVSKNIIGNFGVVSEQTAIAMAKGALQLLKVDLVIATTGLLGPDDVDGVKRGTVWIAVGDENRIETKLLHLRFDREKNKEIVAKMGMLLLWKFLLQKI